MTAFRIVVDDDDRDDGGARLTPWTATLTADDDPEPIGAAFGATPSAAVAALMHSRCWHDATAAHH